MIKAQRIQALNKKPVLGEHEYVLYWMQASQRVAENPALNYAIWQANQLKKPLVVFFGLTTDFPDATRRHYQFMLEGLQEVQKELAQRGIRFVLGTKGPVAGINELLSHVAVLVTDCAYTRLERLWRKQVAQVTPCLVIQVEGNVVVPVAVASQKEEYSAATLRRKIEPMISYFGQKINEIDCLIDSNSINIDCDEASLDCIETLLNKLSFTPSPPALQRGGEYAAHETLDDFIDQHLGNYAKEHNNPAAPAISKLSSYLHFGQISPVEIYTRISSIDLPDVPVFLEQLIVRRELAYNFVQFNFHYDTYEGLPAWAIKTLESHIYDERKYVYSYSELENAQTHDIYWNAAQRELVETGFMHGYMRMYWGKKILEWSRSPREAFETALRLNNTYQLDGRDPNGFAGVAWCFGKHDRPWATRAIYGSIRYMNAKGLERKFDIKEYPKRVESLITK